MNAPSAAPSPAAPPFRADIVGSLLRPRALIEAREAFDGPEFDPIRDKPKPGALVALEDRLVLEAIALQERVGLAVATDGDVRRRSWFADFMVRLGGIHVTWSTEGAVFRSAEGTIRPTPRVNVDGKVRWPEGGIAVEDFRFLRQRTKLTPKVTIPTPLQAYFYGGAIDRAAYPDEDEYWHDMIVAYGRELAALGAAGCTYVQIDECTLIKLCDPAFLAAMRARGQDPAAVQRRLVAILKRLTDRKPAGMTLAIHICRGNSRGHWTTEGDYEPIAEAVFAELGFDACFLEYDSPRAGDFRPLRHVPPGKTVILGLVTTKSPVLEARDALKRRIDEAARFVPLERLCLSPQCGFASSKYGNPLTAADQEAKLRLVVETAADIWR